MATRDVNRAAACYHAFVAIMLLVIGGGLLGVGIWLHVSNNGGPIDLDFTGSDFLNFVLGISIAAIIIGIFLMLTAIVALVALARRCVGKVFRFLYIVLAVIILAVLIFIAVVSFVVLARRNDSFVRDVLKDAWERTVREDPNAICRIEEDFKCRGFDDAKCATETCATCPNATSTATESCYDKIMDDLRRVYLPLGIVSTVVAFFVLADIFVVCVL